MMLHKLALMAALCGLSFGFCAMMVASMLPISYLRGQASENTLNSGTVALQSRKAERCERQRNSARGALRSAVAHSPSLAHAAHGLDQEPV